MLPYFSEDINEEDKQRGAQRALLGVKSANNETSDQPLLIGRPTAALTSYLRRESVSIRQTGPMGLRRPSEMSVGVSSSGRIAEGAGRQALEFSDDTSSSSDGEFGAFAAPSLGDGEKRKLLSSDADRAGSEGGKAPRGAAMRHRTSEVLRASSPILEAAVSVAAAFVAEDEREKASPGSGAEGEAGGHERLPQELGVPPIERKSKEVIR